VPLFIVAFIANTIGLVPVDWHHGLSDLSTWMIAAALAVTGLSTDVHHIRRPETWSKYTDSLSKCDISLAGPGTR